MVEWGYGEALFVSKASFLLAIWYGGRDWGVYAYAYIEYMLISEVHWNNKNGILYSDMHMDL